MDAVTGGLVALGWAGQRLLGPLFDEIANDWKERYSDRRKRNLTRILTNAGQKAQSLRPDDCVNPRVAYKVMDEGSWCESPVMAEYFGGIMAGSISKDGAEDRGMSWATLLSRLSSSDLLLHYLVYDSIRHAYLDNDRILLNVGEGRRRAKVLLMSKATLPVMGCNPTASNFSKIMYFGAQVLVRESLVTIHSAGRGRHLQVLSPRSLDANDYGIVFKPTSLGIELFLWAHGHSRANLRELTSRSLAFKAVERLPQVRSAIPIASAAQVGDNDLPDRNERT